jgi:hypothetical protein
MNFNILTAAIMLISGFIIRLSDNPELATWFGILAIVNMQIAILNKLDNKK